MLLTGASTATDAEGRAAGANAFVRKPFSPLELLETIEQLAGGLPQGPFRLMTDERPEEQLLLYAQDLRRLLELERSQRLLIQSAYEETVSALASALEAKDFGTGAHSNRVTKYAAQLAQAIDPTLLDDQSIEYGFLLHDIGKIAIPDDCADEARAARRRRAPHDGDAHDPRRADPRPRAAAPGRRA